MKNYLPINISLSLNHRFFAEAQWLMYKYFHKTRTIPCGRFQKDKYLCCCQPIIKERVYLSDDETEVFCKVCNHCRIRSNQKINLDFYDKDDFIF